MNETTARELDQAEAEAMVAGDVGALEALWSERMLVTPPGGPTVDRATALELVRSGVLAYAAVERVVEQVVGDAEVLISAGRETVTPASASDAQQERRYTHVWAREGDSWRLLARHASPA